VRTTAGSWSSSVFSGSEPAKEEEGLVVDEEDSDAMVGCVFRGLALSSASRARAA
jgi:hypothetical protein